MSQCKKVALLNTSPPFGMLKAKESLDLALIFGSFEQDTALFFQDDGVWQLIDKQSPESINVKDFLKTFSALPFYDIENIFICDQSLKARSLTPSFHIEECKVLSRSEFINTLNSYQVIYKF